MEVNFARYSVCPEKGIPASFITLFCSGAVTNPENFPSMQPFTEVEGVLDYPFTSKSNLMMDLYLVSKCKFVIGCESGFSTNFPVAFGTPLVVTNLTSSLITAILAL